MVTIKSGFTEVDRLEGLFAEYTNLLVKKDPGFLAYLELQDYDSKLEHLSEQYIRVYVADHNGEAALCRTMFPSRQDRVTTLYVGGERIARYYDSPLDSSIFVRLDLSLDTSNKIEV